jgi:hypothetical protein
MKTLRQLRYKDGRYILMMYKTPEGNTRIIFVGGTSTTVPAGQEVELRKVKK